MNWKDIIEFMIAGSSAIQLGTLNFINPSASMEMLDSLEQYCVKMGIEKISQVTGSFKI